MFVRSETERTTAVTDAVLAVLCLGLACSLAAIPGAADADESRRRIWSAAFGCLAGSSLLGAVVHGVDLSAARRAMLWRPLYLLLGFAVACVAVAAVHDWRGADAARACLPWAMLSAVGFLAVTQVRDGSFVLFLVYEGVATLLALAVYVRLAASGGLPGAILLSAGLALTLVAAAVQASTLRVRIGVTFDHNGLFHLVQMPAVVLVAAGARAGFHA